MKLYYKPLLISLLVLVADQTLKFWVKLHMCLGQEYHLIGHYAILHFTENNGMAFGYELGGIYGKLALTLFRIIAVGGIIYSIIYLTKNSCSHKLVFCIALILGGALGNIIDSTFYGLIFSESHYLPPPAKLFPADGGYSGLFFGKVVDMFYCPLFRGTIPSWIPHFGGQDFVFFQPVFNLADAAITVGVALLLILQGGKMDRPLQAPPAHS